MVSHSSVTFLRSFDPPSDIPLLPTLPAFHVLTLPSPLPCLPHFHPPIKCDTPSPPRATRLSLPTYRERRYLYENHVERAKGRADSYIRATAFNLSVWSLVVRDLTFEETARRDRWLRRRHERERREVRPLSSDSGYDLPLAIQEGTEWGLNEGAAEDGTQMGSSRMNFEIPAWAYVVHIRAGRTTLGKRAVQRNRAKRRIRAAASQVFPQHACRGREYVFGANPEALTIAYPDLVEEVRIALRKTGCWRDEMTIEMLRRERYCKR